MRKPIEPRPHFTAEIVVDFDNCSLINNSTEKETYQPNLMNPEASLLDPRLYDQDTQKYNYHTTIVFELNGSKYYGPVDKDSTTVRFYMITQKHTKIYFDPNNPDQYFFDLRFMNE